MLDFENIELFIFDMDGTLVDSLYDLSSSLEKALIETGYGEISTQAIAEKISFGAKELLSDLIGDHPEHHQEIFDRYVVHYQQSMFDNSPLYPGVKSLLERLKHKKMALLSNKRVKPCLEILQHYKIEHYFDPIIGGDHPIGKKPSPKPIEMICDNLGVLPEHAVMIGDSQADLIAGQKAGCKTIGILKGFTPEKIIKVYPADLWIETLAELKNHLPSA